MLLHRQLMTGIAVVVLGLALSDCGGGSSKSKSSGSQANQASASSQADNERQDAAAKSDARNLVTVVETCFTDSQSYDSCGTEQELSTAAGGSLPGLSFGAGPGQAEVSAHGEQTYTVTAHSRSGNTFTVAKSADGKLTRSCSAKVPGGCRTGAW